jgi:predicted CXXCH cytochrome family protein
LALHPYQFRTIVTIRERKHQGMDRKHFTPHILMALLFVMAACLTSVASRQAIAAPMPEIKKDCSLCHLDIGKGPALRKPVSALCLECHEDRQAPNEHPVDIVPSMKVPKILPLNKGKITCITCHDPHSNAYGKLLRVPQRQLCTQCHPM